jgi:hypothetical protein
MVLILGNYIDFDIKTNRGLPAFNPAASNRMLRLSQSLQSVNVETMIISPACAMRIKWKGVLFHKSKIIEERNVKIFYCLALGVPFLGMLFEQISVFFSILRISRKSKIDSLIVYCYYPSSVIAALLCKFFLGIKIIEDLEDICELKITDWNSTAEANAFQQLIGSFLMKIMIYISDTVIIPTSNFLNFLNFKSKVEVISGCIDVPKLKQNDFLVGNEKICVLFSGALEDENGVSLLIDMLKKMDVNYELSNKFVFEISGHGSKANILEVEIKKLKNLRVNFHGFVSEVEYSNLLNISKIALVLQNPNGRYSMHKTPSKGYEYISNGKMVIISKIGDFFKLPNDVVVILEPYSSDNLIEVFNSISNEEINNYSRKAHDYALNNWDSKIIGKKLFDLVFSK